MAAPTLGNPVEILLQLIRDTQADGIYAQVDFERLYGGEYAMLA